MMKRLSMMAMIGGLLAAPAAAGETATMNACGPAGAPTAFVAYMHSGVVQGFGPYSECRDWGEQMDADRIWEQKSLAWCSNLDPQARGQALGAWSWVCSAAAASAQGDNEAAETYLDRASIPCQTLTVYTDYQGDIGCDCRRAEWWPYVRGRYDENRDD